jgi:hypothetical protein
MASSTAEATSFVSPIRTYTVDAIGWQEHSSRNQQLASNPTPYCTRRVSFFVGEISKFHLQNAVTTYQDGVKFYRLHHKKETLWRGSPVLAPVIAIAHQPPHPALLALPVLPRCATLSPRSHALCHYLHLCHHAAIRSFQQPSEWVTGVGGSGCVGSASTQARPAVSFVKGQIEPNA